MPIVAVSAGYIIGTGSAQPDRDRQPCVDVWTDLQRRLVRKSWSCIADWSIVRLGICLGESSVVRPSSTPGQQLIALLLLAGAYLSTAPACVAAAPVDDKQRRCLALSMYWEARSEGPEGMRAVGWVVLNRVAAEDFPDTVCGVVHDGGETPPCQFSWWCDGRSDVPRERQAWRQGPGDFRAAAGGQGDRPHQGRLFFSSRQAAVALAHQTHPHRSYC